MTRTERRRQMPARIGRAEQGTERQKPGTRLTSGSEGPTGSAGAGIKAPTALRQTPSTLQHPALCWAARTMHSLLPLRGGTTLLLKDPQTCESALHPAGSHHGGEIAPLVVWLSVTACLLRQVSRYHRHRRGTKLLRGKGRVRSSAGFCY